MNLETFRLKLQQMLDDFSEYVESIGVNRQNIAADHVSYRCASNSEYEAIRSLFEFDSAFLYQSIIGKRRIAYIGLHEPLQTYFGDIHYLELSDQKVDNSQVSHCDHIELNPKNITFEELQKIFRDIGITLDENVNLNRTTFEFYTPSKFKVILNREPLVDKIYRDELILSRK